MTCPAGKATQDDPPVLHAAIGLTEQIKAASDTAEAERRLPPSVTMAIQEAGIFGMVMPRAWGGPELDPLMQIRVIEALAMADGSAGWCAMIGCDGGYVSAFLDQSVARTMYPDRLVATGAAATTTGEARQVPGGYRVNGRFPFVSGCHHSEWAWLGCTVVEDGVPRVEQQWGTANAAVLSALVRMRDPGPGTRPACAVPAATTLSSVMCSSRRSAASASRIRN